jgi:hypothetical protein
MSRSLANNAFKKQADVQRIEPRASTAKIHNADSNTPSRRGKIGATLYFEPDTHRVLKELSLEQEKSVTALLMEGTNFMLQHYGRKPIA